MSTATSAADWRPENAGLGVGIGVKVRVAVQVIGGHVEQHRHLRVEGLTGIELEAAHFDHHRIDRPSGIHVADERLADVAPHEDALGRKRRGMSPKRRTTVVLPLVPVTAAMGARNEAGRQFQFADYRDTPGPGGGQWRDGVGAPPG